MRIRHTPRAFADLDAIRTYIDEFNPRAAGRIVALIEDLVAGLAAFPESGQQIEDITRASSFPRAILIAFNIGSSEMRYRFFISGTRPAGP